MSEVQQLIIDTWERHRNFVFCHFSPIGWFRGNYNEEMTYGPSFLIGYRHKEIKGIPDRIGEFFIIQRHHEWRPGVGNWYNYETTTRLKEQWEMNNG